MRSKLCTGTGEGSWNSIERDPHGFAAAGFFTNASDQTRLKMKTSIEAPRKNAETETQSLRNWRLLGYVTARRAWPRKPTAKSTPNAELKKMNIVQKWIFPSRSFSSKPVIFGTQ